MTKHYNYGSMADGIIYNITTQVAWQFHEAWLKWMLDVHIPEILGTGCFFKHQLVRVLETDETDGPIYAVQYYAEAIEEYSRFITLYRPSLTLAENEKWGNAVFSFSSIMQVVN